MTNATPMTVFRAGRSGGGTKRAYTAIILLTLHRHCVREGNPLAAISEPSGSALHELLCKARIQKPNVPANMSNAVSYLREDGFIITETVNTRTYSIRLAGRLSRATLDALQKDEEWARAFISGQKALTVPGAPPEITFVADDEEVDVYDDEPVVDTEADDIQLDVVTEPPSNGHVPETAKSDGFSPLVSMDVAMLMRVVAQQAATIRVLRAQAGYPDDGDGVSGEVAEFLASVNTG